MELNKFYFKHTTSSIPYITVKIAQSKDGKITKSQNEQTWITGKESNRFVHQQRAIYDSVLLGANTVAVDDPQLNVRNVEGRNPKRIILDGKLSIDLNAAILSAEDIEITWILTSKNADKEKLKKITEKGARVIQFNSNENEKIDLMNILTKLAEEKITSLFVEGGGNIFSQFIDANYFDEIIILHAPVTLGKGVNGIPSSSLAHLRKISSEKIGNDFKYVYKKSE
jgi:diaminohydroxyphosphoribosylaminopyrimidine deaminase/5-amino-6-(5-phosphoribosylamino)uracil reductase